MKQSLSKWWLVALFSVCLMGCVSSPEDTRTYDDHKIAMIRRGESTEAQLLEWFGPPDMRDLRPDGRAHLGWRFPHGGSGHYGFLDVNLAPDGKVDFYAARRGPK